MDGKGIYKWYDGIEEKPPWRLYNGDFVKNQKHGQGVVETWEKDTFKGNWKNDEPDGEGKFQL